MAVRVLPGNDHESPVLYALVEQFVQAVGTGVMKRLILDRGFLDGPGISQCKEKYGIDVLIPIRRNMDIYADALALFQEPEVKWVDCPAERTPKSVARKLPRTLAKREKKRQQTLQQLKQQQPPAAPEKSLIKKQAATIGEFRSWSSCSVPLSVVATREQYADGHQEIWFLIDTQTVIRPEKNSARLPPAVAIEERFPVQAL